MARARQSPRRSAPKRSATAARSGPRLGESVLALFRIDIAGIALVLAALAVAVWMSPLADGAPGPRADVAERLGLGVALVALALATTGWMLYRRTWPRTRTAGRTWLGAGAFALFAIGLASFFEPGWSLAGVPLDGASAGGSLGKRLTGGPLEVLVWLGLGAAGFALVWPRWARYLLARTPRIWRLIVAARIPARLWAGASATARGTRWLFRRNADTDVDEMDRIGGRNPFHQRVDTMPEAHSEAGEGSAAFDRILAMRDDNATQLPLDEAALHTSVATTEHPPIGRETTEAAGPKRREISSGWLLPPLDLMKPAGDRGPAAVDNQLRARLIVSTLASFGVDATVVQVNEGPTVTQFGVEPGWEVKTRTIQERDKDGRPILDRDGHPRVRTEEVSRTRVRVNQITSLANDLALALAAPSLRIEAPVPGKPVVGIEVPNHDATVVNMRSVLESPQFQRMANRSKLAIALGQGVSGEPVVADLARMPHLLIAGATGSGKSVCMNAIIASLLMNGSPEDIRFVMIDPKRVELAQFAATPHLAFSRIIVDVDEVPGALQAVISEMEARYRKFAALSARNIDAYNKHPKVVERMPYWVVVIDELADLMMSSAYDVERQICRLAQLARATGIHLIVATQRPSVDVVTGLIKANFPTRIAFAVSSQVDSRTILDATGADKLLGRGDMLYMATDAAQPKRLQGVFVSDHEIDSLVEFWRRQKLERTTETFDHLLEEARVQQEQATEDEQRDPLFERARDLALEHTRISTSMLQRRLRIGYPRAARLMDELEEEGVVGTSEGGASREVLVSAGAIEDDTPWNDPDMPSR